MAVLPSVDLSQAMLTVEQLLRRIAGFDSPLLASGTSCGKSRTFTAYIQGVTQSPTWCAMAAKGNTGDAYSISFLLALSRSASSTNPNLR